MTQCVQENISNAIVDMFCVKKSYLEMKVSCYFHSFNGFFAIPKCYWSKNAHLYSA